jgi:diamine N-acetyltransferase
MDWKIRRACTDDRRMHDLGELALIGAATFLDSYVGILDRDAIVQHCQQTHNTAAYGNYMDAGAAAWLAEVDVGSAPIGYAMVTAPNLPGSIEGDIELKRIYLLSRAYGQGVGLGLMNCAIDYAKELHAKRLVLGAYSKNHQALSFYKRIGFVQFETRKFVIGDYTYDDVVLGLNI